MRCEQRMQMRIRISAPISEMSMRLARSLALHYLLAVTPDLLLAQINMVAAGSWIESRATCRWTLMW